jgi:antitoxin component of MazEF toxin-antitoxin module
MEKPLKVKKSGNSLDLRLPPVFTKANGLRDGDYVVVDLSRLKVIRAEDWGIVGGRAPVIEPAE